MNDRNDLSAAEAGGQEENPAASDAGCELCQGLGGSVLWEGGNCRVVAVDDPDYCGFCRVIWHAHVGEMSELADGQRHELMRVVFAVEAAVRDLYRPDKINLASLGNVVPHLHWHVIPRWRDDRHFPQPIWGAPQRPGSPERPVVSRDRLAAGIAARLST